MGVLKNHREIKHKELRYFCGATTPGYHLLTPAIALPLALPLYSRDGTERRETMFTQPKLVSKDATESGIDADLADCNGHPCH